jgi:hypothetical protein
MACASRPLTILFSAGGTRIPPIQLKFGLAYLLQFFVRCMDFPFVLSLIKPLE